MFKHMRLTTVSNESNPTLNTLQLMVPKVLMFHKNIELLPSSDFYDLSPDNTEPIDYFALVLVGATPSNQLGWVEVAMEE